MAREVAARRDAVCPAGDQSARRGPEACSTELSTRSTRWRICRALSPSPRDRRRANGARVRGLAGDGAGRLLRSPRRSNCSTPRTSWSAATRSTCPRRADARRRVVGRKASATGRSSTRSIRSLARTRRILHAGRRVVRAHSGRHVWLDRRARDARRTTRTCRSSRRRSPYVELRASARPASRQGVAGRDVEYAVYGWSRTPLYSSSGTAWPLPDRCLQRVAQTRDSIWAELRRGSDRFDVYLHEQPRRHLRARLPRRVGARPPGPPRRADRARGAGVPAPARRQRRSSRAPAARRSRRPRCCARFARASIASCSSRSSRRSSCRSSRCRSSRASTSPSGCAANIEQEAVRTGRRCRPCGQGSRRYRGRAEEGVARSKTT